MAGNHLIAGRKLWATRLVDGREGLMAFRHAWEWIPSRPMACSDTIGHPVIEGPPGTDKRPPQTPESLHISVTSMTYLPRPIPPRPQVSRLDSNARV